MISFESFVDGPVLLIKLFLPHTFEVDAVGNQDDQRTNQHQYSEEYCEPEVDLTPEPSVALIAENTSVLDVQHAAESELHCRLEDQANKEVPQEVLLHALIKAS